MMKAGAALCSAAETETQAEIVPSTLVPCVGCGGLFPSADGPTHRYMESSPGCAAAAGAVFSRQYENVPTYSDVYRLTVDAYAVQHPGGRSRQAIQSVGVHLIRLCLVFEHGLTAERANDAIIAATRRKHEFFWLEPPPTMGAITVANFGPDMAVEDFKQTIRDWARSAWDAWAAHHPTIRGWLPAWHAEPGAAPDPPQSSPSAAAAHGPRRSHRQVR